MRWKNIKAPFKYLFFAISYVFILYNIGEITGVVFDYLWLFKPFVYGFVIAYILNPIVVFIESFLKNKCKLKKVTALSMVLSYLFVFLLCFLFTILIFPHIYESGKMIVSELPNTITVVTDWLEQDVIVWLKDSFGIEVEIEYVKDLLISTLGDIFKSVSSTVSVLVSATLSFTTFLVHFLFGLIISIYMLMDKEKCFNQVDRFCIAFFEEDTVLKIKGVCSDAHHTFTKFITARLIDSSIIGVLCFICCMLLGFENALLISVIIGITNVIPYFGPYLGAIPCCFIVLLQGVPTMFLFILFILVLQQFDGNILGPKLLGDSLGLSSLWVIFAVVSMTGLFGLVGMFIGVPLFALVYMLFGRYIAGRIEKKELGSEGVIGDVQNGDKE